jgi:hypothetical protein
MSDDRRWPISKEGEDVNLSGPVRSYPRFARPAPPSPSSQTRTDPPRAYTFPERPVVCACGATIITTSPNCRRCPECAHKAQREQQKEYMRKRRGR